MSDKDKGTGAGADTTGAGAEATGDADTGKQTMVPFEEFQKVKDQKTRIDAIARDWEKKFTDLNSKFSGVDIEAYREMTKKVEEAERKAAERDPVKMEELTERKIGKLRGEYEGKLSEATKEIGDLKARVKEYAVTDKVMGEIGKLFNDDVQKFIKAEVSRYCDLDEDDGIIIRDDNGDIRFTGNKPMTPKEFGDILVSQYPTLAKATGMTGGSNATNGQRAPGRPMNKVPETMAELNAMPNPREVLERLKRENPAAVQKILQNTGA
jgi:hypothetical protein